MRALPLVDAMETERKVDHLRMKAEMRSWAEINPDAHRASERGFVQSHTAP